VIRSSSLATAALLVASVAPAAPMVVVSIPPQAMLVSRLAGDAVEVRTLLPPGASPATYAPGPRQVAELTAARAWVRIGVPFERALIDRIPEIAPDVEVVLPPRAPAPPADDAHTHHGSHDDPHVWLDADLLAAHAGAIAELLTRVLPHEADAVAARLVELRDELDRVDRRIAARLAPYAGRPVFVFHPAFGYFTSRYGLVQVAVEVEGGEPSPRHLAEMVERAEASGVRTVFVQPQVAGRGARALADAIGGHVETLDPLAPDPVANLEHIAAAIAMAMEER
jgi:zinc transport system substrate-binding protein